MPYKNEESASAFLPQPRKFGWIDEIWIRILRIHSATLCPLSYNPHKKFGRQKRSDRFLLSYVGSRKQLESNQRPLTFYVNALSDVVIFSIRPFFIYHWTFII